MMSFRDLSIFGAHKYGQIQEYHGIWNLLLRLNFRDKLLDAPWFTTQAMIEIDQWLDF